MSVVPFSSPHPFGVSVPMNLRVQHDILCRVRAAAARPRERRLWSSKVSEIRVVPYVPLGNQAGLVKHINLRNKCYRQEAGGQKLEYETLGDRFDPDSLFLDFWSGSDLIHSFRASPSSGTAKRSQFAEWTRGKWVPEGARQLVRGCTLSEYRKCGLYGASLSLMIWLLSSNSRKFRKAAVMLSESLETNAPRLMRLFFNLGFERLSVKDVTRKKLSDVEIASNAFSCECGYSEPIMLTPWEIDLTADGIVDRAASFFGHYAGEVEENLQLPIRLSLDELVRPLMEFEDRSS